MIKIRKNKKGFLVNALVLLVCFLTFVVIGFIFYILFGIFGNLSVYGIGSDFESPLTHYEILNYLRIPTEVDGNKMNMADLMSLYCDQQTTKEEYKVRIYALAQQKFSPTTITLKLVCSENKELMLRDPLCDNPFSIKMPSFSGKTNEIQYCDSTGKKESYFPATIKSPDGKYWEKIEFDGKTYYREVGREPLITPEEFNEKYSDYVKSEEYTQKLDKFTEDVRTKKEVIAPDGSHWMKINDKMWCLTADKHGRVRSCESTIVPAEKLIETKGNIPVGTHIDK